MKNVNDIYKYCKEQNTPMLSSYSGEWWTDYITDYEAYDKVFRRLYYSFLFFMQSHDETIAEVSENFVDEVEGVLLAHDKEFSELYRIQSQALDAYKLTDNYDMEEKLTRTTGENLGARSDSYTNNTGAQSNSTTGTVAPYDSETFLNDNQVATSIGARQDGGTATTGAQNNTGSENYTLTRKGNIGVSTATDMMKKHKDFWESFNFYHYVFSVIAKELLSIGG